MRGKWWASAAPLALAMACVPLPAAAARSGTAHPEPGAEFIGAPRGFGSDQMHWRVSSNDRTMTFAGSFAWSYGCTHPLHNYGIADSRTLARPPGGQTMWFAAPALSIRGTRFAGATAFRRHGRRYHFAVRGTFTSARTVRMSFSFADPPHCGTFAEHFTLHAV